MSQEYKSFSRTEITAAFALAHRLGERCTIPQYRKHFKKIARLIWDAAGEQKPMPAQLPDELEQLANEAAAETGRFPHV